MTDFYTPLKIVTVFHPPVTYINHLGMISAASVRDLNAFFAEMETIFMARAAKKPNRQFNPSNMTFVNYKLNKQEKSKYNDWVAKQGDAINRMVASLLENEHKISFSQTPGENVVRCSITCVDSESPNANMCMTSRGSDWGDALSVAIFKIEVLANGGLWADLDEGDDWG